MLGKFNARMGHFSIAASRAGFMWNRFHRNVRGCALIVTIALLSACATAPPIARHALVGQWRQAEHECGMALDVRELEFHADGRFSVTWRPFETYRDYWGRWSFDERTRELALVMEGGNNRPADFVGRGRIRLADGALHLGEISLGSAYGRGPCPASFRPMQSR